MLRRSPDLIIAAIAGIIVLRAALWINTSTEIAYFLVATLLPLWIALEIVLLLGTVTCAYGLVTGREVAVFGRPAGRQIAILLCLLGVVTLLFETGLWLYGLGLS